MPIPYRFFCCSALVVRCLCQYQINLTLPELPVAISVCDFFFGIDGGPMHMAVGTRVPSLAVFSPINEKENWLPLNHPKHQGFDLKDGLDVSEDQRRTMSKQIKENLEKHYQEISPSITIKKLDKMIDEFILTNRSIIENDKGIKFKVRKSREATKMLIA